MKTYVRRHKMVQDCAAAEDNLPPEDEEEDILHLTLAQLISQTRGNSPTPSPNVDDQGNATDLVPQLSTLTRRCAICQTLGSVVWAKLAPQLWWPAQVLIRDLPAPNSGTDVTEGPVFVQYYGSKECGLVDPAKDLLPFEDCFEERSCNPSEDFQEALKQAKKQLNLTNQSITSSEGHACYDTGNPTSSSRTGSDCLKKGSRKRLKTKAQFNEVNVPSTSVTDSRKMRLKRAFGLVPPAGSPVAQSPTQE